MSAGLELRERVRGFTLIELIVVVALIAIMMGLAAPNFVRFQRSSELTGTANALLGSMAAARAEAMRRNRNAFVMPIDALSWRAGWRVFVDMNNDSAYTEGTDVLVMSEAAMPTSIATPGTGVNEFSDGTGKYVMFNGSGYPRKSDGSFITSSGLELSFDAKLRRRVILSPSGRLRVCDPVRDGETSCAP